VDGTRDTGILTDKICGAVYSVRPVHYSFVDHWCYCKA